MAGTSRVGGHRGGTLSGGNCGGWSRSAARPNANVVPAKAGTHNHRRQLFRGLLVVLFSNHIGRGVWVPAFAGTTREVLRLAPPLPRHRTDASIQDAGHGQSPCRGKAARRRTTALNFLVSVMLALMIGAAPAAAVEQCRFIRAKPDREACYERQAVALAAKRKPEPSGDATTMESLQQMRREDDAVYRSLRGICRGC